MAVTNYLYNIDDVDVATAERHLGDHLNNEEIQRILRMKHIENRQTSMLGRILLRRLLAVKLDCKPLDVGIAVTKYGKPVLDHGVPFEQTQKWNLSGEAQYFNVSHSGSYVAIALSDVGEVGVDVEAIKPRDSVDDLAVYVMHPKELGIYQSLTMDAAKQFFYRTWVLKEAYTKYVGEGIQMGLKSVITQVDPPAILVSPELTAQFLSVPEGYVASIVFKSEAEFEEAVCQKRVASVFEI